MEILRKKDGKDQHYAPSRCGMFQMKKMLKRLANDNRYEEYDQDVLFAYLRPEFGSPDWEIMMKLIGERRRGVVAKPPDPLASHEDAVYFHYI